MSFQFIGLVTALIGVAILAAPLSWAFVIMTLSTVFGAAAAFSLPALGGASVLVPNLFLVFYAIRLLMALGEGPVLAALAPPRAGFWLLFLTAFGLVTAVFFPRLFQGVTETMIVQRTMDGRSFISSVPLQSSANNITQAVYAVGGLLCFALTHAFFRRSGTPALFVTAMLAAAVVNLGFAVADVVTYYTGTEHLLGFVRTASYALLTAAEKGGLKRISGSFPEASAFADYTVILFAVIASLWLDRVRTLATGAVSFLLLAALILSTSATALIGLGAVLLYLMVRSWASSMRGAGAGRPAVLLLVAAAVPVIALALPALAPELTSELSDFIDEILLSKADSQSGRERFMWNMRAYETFLDTGGFGAGLGSARASSYALVLLSNVGAVGTLLFCLFAGSVLLARTRPRVAERKWASAAARAAKAGVFAALASAMVSGTVYDLGLTIYILAASVAAFTHRASAGLALPDFAMARRAVRVGTAA